jgi:hypothetical protein
MEMPGAESLRCFQATFSWVENTEPCKAQGNAHVVLQKRR